MFCHKKVGGLSEKAGRLTRRETKRESPAQSCRSRGHETLTFWARQSSPAHTKVVGGISHGAVRGWVADQPQQPRTVEVRENFRGLGAGHALRLVLRTQPRSHHQLGMHGRHSQGQPPVPGVAVSMARRATNSKAHTKAPSRLMPGEVKLFHAPPIWVDYRPRQRCQSRCETSRGRRDVRHAARRPHQH